MTLAETTKTIPLIESFGPVVQGEGYLAGLPTLFLRFGLCDFRCDWCDSKYAVEPEVVNREARRVTTADLIAQVTQLADWPGLWITLSGGNPAMHELGAFVAEARAAGYLVSCETQGSIWRGWLGQVDHLTISPKPPSSGMVTDKHDAQLVRFLGLASDTLPPIARSVKIVVFDEEDLEWARSIIKNLDPSWMTYLSVGTMSVSRWGSEEERVVGPPQVRNEIGDEYAWLCDQVAADPDFARTRVLPQLHVVAYGHARGV